MQHIKLKGLLAHDAHLDSVGCYVFLTKNEEVGVELALSCIDTQVNNFLVSQDIERFFNEQVLHGLPFDFSQLCDCAKPFEIDKDYFSDNVSGYFTQLLDELTFYNSFTKAQAIIHLSEDLLVQLSSEKLAKLIAQLNKVANKRKIRFMLLLTGQKALELRTDILALGTQLSGLAHIDSQATKQQLIYDFWHHDKGVSSQVVYDVELAGHYSAQLFREEVEHATAVSFTDNDKVIINRKLLQSDTKLPPNYEVCDDNNDIYYLGKLANAATLIFSADQSEDKIALAKMCFRLRKERGSWLKIIIKNKDGILRHHDECVFLTLGVSLILHATTDISRLFSQVQAIQGVKFGRLLPDDYQSVLEHAKGSELKGYLPVHDFIEEVAKQRDASFNTGISGVLIVLNLVKGLAPIDALSLFSVKRSGDIFTASKTQVFLYLHACRENDVDAALERLFRLAISEFFSGHSVYSEDLYVDQESRKLRKLAMALEVEDYSEQLSSSLPSIVKPASNSDHYQDKPQGPAHRLEPKPVTMTLRKV